jgi:hypothetical protein
MRLTTCGRAGRLHRAVAALFAVPLVLGLAPAVASAAGSDSVSVIATVAGSPIAHTSSEHPVQLEPGRHTSVHLLVTNPTSTRVVVQSVEIKGTVVGLDFYSFDTSVDLDVAAHSTARLGFVLDTRPLSGQATGLIPGSLTLLDSNGNVVASQSMVTNVHGSLISVYGLFGLAVLVLTGLAIADVLLAMARHRMSANRWRRGLRFMTPGIGLGFVLVFTMSALGLWTPTADTWFPVCAIFAAAFFVGGYLTPTPLDADDDTEDDDNDFLDEDGYDDDNGGANGTIGDQPTDSDDTAAGAAVRVLAAHAAPVTVSSDGQTFVPPPGNG